MDSDCDQPVFGLWRAPSPPAPDGEHVQTEQGHRGRHITQTPNSLVHSLHEALLSAQNAIKQLTSENISLREENARLTLKERGDHEALQELTSLHAQAKKEKEVVEAEVKHMKEETCRFQNRWLAAQSHNQQLEEQVRESTQELYECRRQVTRTITSVENILCTQRQETTARISALDDYWREVVRVWEECAAIRVRESEQKSQRIGQLEEEVAEKGRLIQSLTNNIMSKSDVCKREKRWEGRLNALEEKYRRALSEIEESWQRRVQETERTDELGRTWLQKEGEWRQRNDALQDEIQRLNKEIRGLSRKTKKRKQWWRRRWMLGRRARRRNTEDPSEETTSLLLE